MEGKREPEMISNLWEETIGAGEGQPKGGEGQQSRSLSPHMLEVDLSEVEAEDVVLPVTKRDQRPDGRDGVQAH